MSIIVKNTSTIDTHDWGGRTYSPEQEYTIEEIDRLRLLSDSEFLTDLSNDIALIKDGSIELNTEQGLLYLQKQLKEVHEAISFSPAVGIVAPALVTLSATSAAHGYEFEMGDELYALTHFDQLILNDVKLQLHIAIDNSTADRWIQFDFTMLSTTGILDRAIDGYDSVVSTGPIEVPTTPFLVFETKITVPSSLFTDERDNLFVRVKRTVPTGKTAPTNNPIVVRLDKIHKQKLDI